MIYVLMNPKANNCQGEKDAREWAKCLNEEPTYINVLETEDMKGFLLSLNEEDVIIVAGGDGTIHHFINSFSRQSRSLEVIHMIGICPISSFLF